MLLCIYLFVFCCLLRVDIETPGAYKGVEVTQGQDPYLFQVNEVEGYTIALEEYYKEVDR